MAILQCTNPKCNFVFNEEKEDQKFNDLTEEWVCPNPNCRSIKDSFSEIEEEHIEPADEEKKSGTPEDEQDLEKKQNPEDKLDLEKKQNLEDEQDLEKKEDPEDRKSPQMTKGRRKRAQIKDFKDENGIYPDLWEEKEFECFNISYVLETFTIDVDSLAKAFRIKDYLKDKIVDSIKKDATLIAKLLELTVASVYDSVYEREPQPGALTDLKTKPGLFEDKSMTKGVEVRTFNKNTSTRIHFTMSSAINYEGLKTKLRMTTYYEFVDITNFPECEIFLLPFQAVIVWLFLDDKDWLGKGGSVSKEHFKDLLSKTKTKGIIRKPNGYFQFISKEEYNKLGGIIFD